MVPCAYGKRTCGPLGTILQRTEILGNILTDAEGHSEAKFVLESPPVILSSPGFIIESQSDWRVAFATNYGPIPPFPPTSEEKGRIVLNMQTLPGSPINFEFMIDYGVFCGYPDGLWMEDNRSIDSGYNIPPGDYVINEILPSVDWMPPDISIVDLTGGSTYTGTQTNINLAPGETATVTYINWQPLPLP